MGTLPTSVTTGTGTWLVPNQYGIVKLTAQIGSSSQVDQYRFYTHRSNGFYTPNVGGSIDSQLRVYYSNGAALSGAINSWGSASFDESYTLVVHNAGSWYYFDVA